MSEMYVKDGNLTTTSENINELIAGKGVCLNAESQEYIIESDDEDDLSVEYWQNFEEATEKWRNADFARKTFAELREEMTEIRLGIYKKVLLEGFGDPIPASDARVTIAYSIFLEQKPVPVDSTFLTGKNLCFVTGDNCGLLVGLEEAVMSMRVHEQAQFIIPYSCLYGEFGCRPRIPPKADGLLLIRVVKVEPMCADLAVQEHERKDYSGVKRRAEELRNSGRIAFSSNRYTSAAHAFIAAARILERADAANMAEDQERNHLVVTLLINAGMAFNKLAQPRKACVQFNSAQTYFPDVPQDLKAKLFLHKGRALHALGDYKRAKNCLLTAQQHSNSPTIANALALLKHDQEKYDEDVSIMMQKAFNLKKQVEKSQDIDAK
ncbi:inactive peptidyl-prolyl cis-trans isomerase shutdown-like [Phlebotomus argentipes]|uniref:inactive peptidyl-prolyl cis-trans isomerase shutdown-like n=1 Tax=Phlebotomus argentipes TaxID=94469 RepID=UPI00289346C9|nr:inactive peptidyl-prolyl cis-trans isomerase shutdown-like [Phlebotomus argentipes]